MILRGTVQEHRTTRDAWAVVTFLLDDEPVVEEGDGGAAPAHFVAGAVVTCVGDRLGLAGPEEGLELVGDVEATRYGLQVRVREQTSTGISAAPQAQRWLERLDGVGPALARRIFERFGSSLVEVLSGESWAELCEVSGISPDKARVILESFQEIGQSGDLEQLQYLDGLGATRWEAAQVLKFAKARRLEPSELMRGRPYDLLDAKGLGWAKVDKLARFAGCPPDAPARVEAGTLHVLDEQVQEGSTMIRLGHLMRSSCEALGVGGELVHAAIIRCAGSGRLVLADEDGTTWVHPAALYRAERAIYKAATAGLAHEPAQKPTRDLKTAAAVRLELARIEAEAEAENEAQAIPEDLAPVDGLGAHAREGRQLPDLTDTLSALPPSATLNDLLDAAIAADPGGDW